MSFVELDVIAILLRVLTYAGTITVAGGVLIQATMGRFVTANLVRRQVVLGAVLLIVSEPLRYVHFQIAIAQGDVALAFDPSMRWLALETPLGQATTVRLASLVVVMLSVLFANSAAAIGGAVVMVSSYLIEGHTASAAGRPHFGRSTLYPPARGALVAWSVVAASHDAR